MSNIINYMWRFKPDEKNPIPQTAIHCNLKYIKNYKIITPPIIIDLLSNNNIFTDLLELYNRAPHWIIKADLGRLLIIYFRGGIYSDTDCVMNKEFRNKTKAYNVILFTEGICQSVEDLGPRECKNPENIVRIANFYFVSRLTKHPFFKEVIDECIHRLQKLLNENKNINYKDIIWVCGPDVITTIYHKSKKKYHDIILLPQGYLNHMAWRSWWVPRTSYV